MKNVLEGKYSFLRENLIVDSDLASKLFGWKPQLLAGPPYREIRALNDLGKHHDAFEKWYVFSESSYTEDRLEVFCECLKVVGKNTRPKLKVVAEEILKELKGKFVFHSFIVINPPCMLQIGIRKIICEKLIYAQLYMVDKTFSIIFYYEECGFLV